MLSTAIHDFQGIAILEAVAAGYQPLVPDRLACPELFAKHFRYPSCESDPAREAKAIADPLEAMTPARESGEALTAQDVRRLSWRVFQSGYRQWIEDMAAR